MLDACQQAWRKAWVAGSHLTVDESMIWWTGLTSGHLSYLPRKPTPLGFQLKTTCDSRSKVMLAMELVEGEEID